jgi:hypothetical protein
LIVVLLPLEVDELPHAASSIEPTATNVMSAIARALSDFAVVMEYS